MDKSPDLPCLYSSHVICMKNNVKTFPVIIVRCIDETLRQTHNFKKWNLAVKFDCQKAYYFVTFYVRLR